MAKTPAQRKKEQRERDKLTAEERESRLLSRRIVTDLYHNTDAPSLWGQVYIRAHELGWPPESAVEAAKHVEGQFGQDACRDAHDLAFIFGEAFRTDGEDEQP